MSYSAASSVTFDDQRTCSLLQYMNEEGAIASAENESKMKDAIDKLQQVHGLESDIDALCIGPSYATMAEDFFIVLRNMLQSAVEVSEILCVKDARVPIMRFKVNGISFDLPYASLPVSPLKYEDILDPFFIEKLGESTQRSLSAVQANMHIRRFVPNLELFGYFGGIHLAILAAYVCQKYPKSSVTALISLFFITYSCWSWSTPVSLQDESISFVDAPQERLLLPIVMPCGPPYHYCHSNITRSTFEKIKKELNRAHSIMQGIGRSDFVWRGLFSPFPYTKNYNHFVRIFLAASDDDELRDWMGWVKSCFCSLIIKLERNFGFCDPNPTEYIDHDIVEPNTIFYWGLLDVNGSADISSIEKEVMEILGNSYEVSSCKLQLSIVDLNQLPATVLFACGSGKESKACWRILDYCEWREPVYSKHEPEYFVGYVETDCRCLTSEG